MSGTVLPDFGLARAQSRQKRRLDTAAEWLVVREVQMERMQHRTGLPDAEQRAEHAYWRARAWSMLAQAVWEAGRGDDGQKRLALHQVLRARRESRAIAVLLWGAA